VIREVKASKYLLALDDQYWGVSRFAEDVASRRVGRKNVGNLEYMVLDFAQTVGTGGPKEWGSWEQGIGRVVATYRKQS
jgi:hypothetical protein